MREMNTDRRTRRRVRSPWTPGHFQIEADILSYGYDRYNPRTLTRGSRRSPLRGDLKLGVRKRSGFAARRGTYTSIRTHDVSAGTVEKNRGFGDVRVRAKWNRQRKMRRDGPGAHALRQAANQRADNLAITPSKAVRLCRCNSNSRPVECGLDDEIDVVRDKWRRRSARNSELHYDQSGYIPCPCSRGFFSAVSREANSIGLHCDVGLTYGSDGNVQLDPGSIWASRGADDINPLFAFPAVLTDADERKSHEPAQPERAGAWPRRRACRKSTVTIPVLQGPEFLAQDAGIFRPATWVAVGYMDPGIGPPDLAGDRPSVTRC